MTSHRDPTVVIELVLLGLALFWYSCFYALTRQERGGINGFHFDWLFPLGFVPIISVALAFEMNRRLKASNRPLRLWEIALIVLVTPQFLGALGVWGMILYPHILNAAGLHSRI